MSNITISDRAILDYAGNTSSYHSGNMYFLNNKVTNFSIDNNNLTIHAVVDGEYMYDVSISFSEDWKVKFSKCNCPAFSRYHGACKHVVAVLKMAQRELQKMDFTSIYNRKAAGQIFGFFESLGREQNKEEINMDITYEVEQRNKRTFSSIELKLGKSRLYVVRNIKDFISSINKGAAVEFSKNFTFEPNIHTFSNQNKAVIDLLLEIYKSEVMLENVYSYRYSDVRSAFTGKKVYLCDSNLKRLIEIIKDKLITLNMSGMQETRVGIIEGDIPLKFSLKQTKENITFALDSTLPVPLIEGGEYCYYEGNIHHISEQQKKYFFPLYENISKNPKREIVFLPENKGRFVSEVLPYVKNIALIDIDSALEENFCQEELETKIYFDKAQDGIKAKIEFQYGEQVINPFISSDRNASDALINKKILIRDVRKERNLLGLLEEAEFKVNSGEIYLDEEDEIFDFMSNVLPKIQELAEIYYSAAFKTMQIRNASSFSGRVRLNEDSNMLEFSFQYEDVEPEELEHIFNSLREKKKYYRLRDGSFVPLNTSELEDMAGLIDHLDISAKDLKNKMLELPKYRAMYIDSYMRQSNLQHIERNRAFKQLVQSILEPQDTEYDIPIELQHILRDYQKVGFKWLKTLSAYGLGGILADDMGLGKTLEVIAFILSEKEKNSGSSIVIAPTSLVYNWQDEVKKFAPQLKVQVISGMQKERQEQLAEIKNADIVVTSYPLIRRDIDLYDQFEFAYCFLDEAQHIKNPNTISAKSVGQIKAKGYFALTGTPIENTLTELWSIFNSIMPGYLLSHNKFVKKYENPIIKNREQKVLGELSRHIKPFVLRRMKKDVLKELPQKIETKVTVEMTAEQKKVYLAYLQKAKGELTQEISANGFGKSQIKILAALTRLRQICCHPALFLENFNGDSGKMLLLQEILEDALDSGHRILLFSQFTSMLDIIEQYLNKEKIEHFYLQGSTKVELRGEMVKAFNAGKGKIFLISLKAGGTGLNLTGADMVIHYDPWWNPAVEDQATDRAYRIGQKNVVQVMKLITQGTIEEKIYELQQKKKEIIESVIQSGETFLTKLSEKEIKELFEM